MEHGSTGPRPAAGADGTDGTDGADGGTDVTVRVEAVRAGDGDAPVGFALVDDGSGFDPDDLDAVFDRGYSTRTGGTGYGLAIVRDVAEAHGWDVAAGTGPDGGARVTFTDVDCRLEGE